MPTTTKYLIAAAGIAVFVCAVVCAIGIGH
jgi:hypothetical protein